jgi:hypothetical protein
MSSLSTRSYCIIAVVACAACEAAPAPQDWSHGWDTLLQSQFADFGYASYTDADAIFLAAHYAGLSVEKCSGPNNTEEVVWANARLIKSKNAATKMVFYWATDQAALLCYGESVRQPYLSNPSLWLKDDAGDFIYANPDAPVMDYCNPMARAWWTGVPLYVFYARNRPRYAPSTQP